MEQPVKFEEELWAYIDGQCSEADATRIEQLIAGDEAWSQRYRELRSFNDSLASAMDLAEPSMRFTKNVMDQVMATNIAPATGKYLNPKIVRGITLFFFAGILFYTFYLLLAVKWNAPVNYMAPKIKAPKINIDVLTNKTTLYIIIAIILLLGLALMDLVLRRKVKDPTT